MSEVTIEDINAAIPPEEYFQLAGQADSVGYNNCSYFAAKTLLGVARRDPVAFGEALDAFRSDPYSNQIDALLTPEEKALLFEGRWGLTGFQWGWAVNTVAILFEQEAVPSPAIIQLDGTHRNQSARLAPPTEVLGVIFEAKPQQGDSS